ncbi:MAG: PhoH family protein [Planctomycetia bacterium]|nr:PhoH family protein [Planctomycetia bacterium]
MEETIISVINARVLRNVFGASDEHLRRIRKSLGIRVTVDRDKIVIRSEDKETAKKAAYLFEQLQRIADREGAVLSADDIQRTISEVQSGEEISQIRPMDVYSGQRVRPKTAGQAKYVEMLRQKEIVFCTGPAGTGKTYLAVARAVEALRTEGIRKIVLVRPAVEAGENLGFLPGDLQAKINPYLRPLFDSLADMMDHEMLQRYMNEDRIEVIPLAYMRGRTINSAYIILDEAQNTTVSQMKMFLTRMGDNSRIAVCGDATQTDLPRSKQSGLVDALIRLKNIDGIGHIALNETDIVRHSLVQKIVNAYETNESESPPFFESSFSQKTQENISESTVLLENNSNFNGHSTADSIGIGGSLFES